MPVKHVVLGLLLERRSYGYELVQRLTERLSPAWQLTPSGVYWALDQLERAGQIEAALHHSSKPADEPLSRRARRVVYSITPADSPPIWHGCSRSVPPSKTTERGAA
jgi:DNA-binding PadR family transcriptional regulator